MKPKSTEPEPTRRSYIDDDGEVRELDAHFFATATRGQPPIPPEKPQKPVNILLDADVIAHFKAAGKNWQTRINTALRKAAGLS